MAVSRYRSALTALAMAATVSLSVVGVAAPAHAAECGASIEDWSPRGVQTYYDVTGDLQGFMSLTPDEGFFSSDRPGGWMIGGPISFRNKTVSFANSSGSGIIWMDSPTCSGGGTRVTGARVEMGVVGQRIFGQALQTD